MLSTVFFGNSFMSPIHLNFMFFSIKLFASSLITTSKRDIKAFTSILGRDQFSVENAKRLRYFISFSKQNSIHSLTLFFAWMWPFILVLFLFSAHLPLPSIIMAICFSLFFSLESIRKVSIYC